jgi:hypothetical protein
MAGTDREKELADRLAVLEGRLADVETRAASAEARANAGLLDAWDTLLGAVLPTEVRGHLRAARKEQLLAVRSMVDIWIERVDRKPGERRHGRHRETIKLEDA